MNQAWANYLRRAMKDAGYEPDGPRTGGRTRLADDSDVSLPVISKSLNEGRTPDPATLRKLTGPLKKTYRELLIAAGHATPEDLPLTAPPLGPVRDAPGEPPALAADLVRGMPTDRDQELAVELLRAQAQFAVADLAAEKRRQEEEVEERGRRRIEQLNDQPVVQSRRKPS